MASINEVAALAGVSKATVSRTINNTGYVSEKTRKKIEKVIEEMEYVPSASAVSLSKGVTNGIGVVVPEIDNTFYGDVLRGIIDEANKSGTQLFFYDTQNDAKKEKETLRAIERQQLLGLIIAPSVDYTVDDESKEIVSIIDKLDIPTVIVDRDFENIQWDGVFFENFKSAYTATEELIKAGNRRIGIITGGKSLKISRDRYRGFAQAMADNGLEVKGSDVLEGNFLVDKAYELSKKMFKTGDYPEAMITCNNRTSVGLLKAMNEYKIRLGKDMALIGIDDLPVLAEAGFSFSCISRNNQEMGSVAMQLIRDRIENKESSRKMCIVSYNVELRGSEKRR